MSALYYTIVNEGIVAYSNHHCKSRKGLPSCALGTCKMIHEMQNEKKVYTSKVKIDVNVCGSKMKVY